MDAPTATAKRKRPAAPAAGADIAVAAQAVVEEVSDAEVEEFYAILRRMRDTSRRFVSGTGARATAARAPAARAPAWSPSFSWEDFAPPAPSPAPATATTAPPSQQRRPQVDEQNGTPPPRRPGGVCLDLNAEPEPEAPATPRAERVSA